MDTARRNGSYCPARQRVEEISHIDKPGVGDGVYSGEFSRTSEGC